MPGAGDRDEARVIAGCRTIRGQRTKVRKQHADGWVPATRGAMSGGSHSLHGRRDLRYLRQRRLPAGLTAAAAALVVAAGCSSGTGSSPAGPPARPAASAAIASCRRQYGSDCYTPQQLQIAYDIQPPLQADQPWASITSSTTRRRAPPREAGNPHEPAQPGHRAPAAPARRRPAPPRTFADTASERHQRLIGGFWSPVSTGAVLVQDRGDQRVGEASRDRRSRQRAVDDRAAECVESGIDVECL